MPRPHEKFSEEERGKLISDFKQANPDYWEKLQGRARDIERARRIIDHTSDAHSLMEGDHRQEKPGRIASEAAEVWRERTVLAGYLPHHVRAHVLAENSIVKEAERRVEAQYEAERAGLFENRETAIRRIADGEHLREQSISEEEIKTMTEQQKATHFKAELHKLVDNANEAKFQVSKIVNNERARMLEEARANGSDNPTEDVKALQSSMYKGVQDKLHGDIHALCVRYGYDADRQQVEFLADAQDNEIEEAVAPEVQNEAGETTTSSEEIVIEEEYEEEDEEDEEEIDEEDDESQ